MPLMFQPLVKYADFDGRARRAEYWLFTLFGFLLGVAWWIVIAMIAAASSAASGGSSPNPTAGGLAVISTGVFGLVSLGLIIPSLAVAVRRLHDIDKSGAWFLINLLPFIGPIVFLVFALMDGTMGPNRYGPDPKGRAPFSPPGATVTEVHHYHHGAPPDAAPRPDPGAA